MLVRFSKRPQTSTIKVSQSTGKGDEITTAEHRTEDLIVGDTKVVRIAPPSGNITETVASRGCCRADSDVLDGQPIAETNNEKLQKGPRRRGKDLLFWS